MSHHFNGMLIKHVATLEKRNDFHPSLLEARTLLVDGQLT
jgi:hypothetical protein